MKRILTIIGITVLVFALVSCGAKDKTEKKEKIEDKSCEVAVISEKAEEKDGTLTQAAWHSAKKFSEDNDLKAKRYLPKEASHESYMASVKEAADDKAKIIIMAGSIFETAVYEAQTAYPDIKFLILDGVPHSTKNKYAMGENTVSIVFAEEEAGYLAGYAAVKDGYKKLGFMGEDDSLSVERYGHGFVQGAAAAASETKTKVQMKYQYIGATEPSKEVEKLAQEWYKADIQVIFACGDMGRSVMKSAEKEKGKVIGVDVDQSKMSDTVITSAEKGIDHAVTTVLKSYESETFSGGTAFNYAARNDGVSLETDNGRFNKFTKEDYKKVFKQLKNGKITLKKDSDVSSIGGLAGEWLKIQD